jgi:uncharacterized protein YqgC (DUF456 family)
MLATIIASMFIGFGILGTFLPVLPGTVIAFTGIALHKLLLGEASVSWGFVAVALGITVVTVVIDVYFTWWGARRFGATWLGATGAVLGALIGFLFMNLPGLIIGPFAGAVLFELLANRTGAEATRAGFGTIVGAVFAFAIKLGLTAGMGAAFYIALVGV